MHDIIRIMEHINAGKNKTGKPMWPKEQAAVSEMIDAYEFIDALPELSRHLEKINDWWSKNHSGELPPSPSIYYKSAMNNYRKLAKEINDGSS